MHADTVKKFRDEIAETRGLAASLKAFIKGLFDRLRAVDDPEEVKALVAEFDAAQAELTAAMVENPEEGDPVV